MKNLQQQISEKIEQATDILEKFGMPSAQLNDRTAYCLLALLNVTPEKSWENIENPLIGITPMMDFTKINYQKEYAPNSRETFRRFSVHQLVQAGIVLYNPDDSSRPVNSPKAVYQISPVAFDVIKTYGTKDFETKIQDFLKNQESLSKQYAHEREMNMVSVKIKDEHSIQISPGKHSELIKDIIEQLAPRFLPNSTLVYIGDTGEKWGYYDQEIAGNLLFNVLEHGKMPDVILYVEDKKWLVLVESVTSHGPVDSKRYIELKDLFSNVNADLVFISAFPDRSTFVRFAHDIAWETEAWIADNPDHMIHFNGDKFIGPHK
ncbi:BsuBI/PstI family type II restriction endonuclease [uncultured Treponema sp.]|uniref:BsuBI/PstI family type II restriction endonuclease n=1 Tax=uncultured Treponema sp. TaxID=162155 RepID=UPI0025D1834F|nr:BsuBI/PstI family type II restriction endonuclease [uncultured Treponema sp.]